MRAKRTMRRRPTETPKSALEGSAWVRKYLIDLYDREDGAAANWQLIAETAFKVGLDAIDAAPQSQRRVEMLNRLHEAAYHRLARNNALVPVFPLPNGPAMALQSSDPAHTLRSDV